MSVLAAAGLHKDEDGG